MPSRNTVRKTLAESIGEFTDLPPETPQQRKNRLSNAQQHTADTQSMIAEHEAREDQRMRSLIRRAQHEMLTMNDLMGGVGPMPSRSDAMLPEMNRQMLTEEFPTKHDDIIMEDLYRQQSGQTQPRQRVQPQQSRQRQTLTEGPPLSASDIYISDGSGRKVTDSIKNWRTKRYLGETRGGTEVHVWKVENTKTGNGLRTLFRIEAVASRIAMILNESNDPNDTRVISLVNAYEKRDKLIKEARVLEKSSDGKQMKSERLRALQTEINQLSYRLGV